MEKLIKEAAFWDELEKLGIGAKGLLALGALGAGGAGAASILPSLLAAKSKERGSMIGSKSSQMKELKQQGIMP